MFCNIPLIPLGSVWSNYPKFVSESCCWDTGYTFSPMEQCPVSTQRTFTNPTVSFRQKQEITDLTEDQTVSENINNFMFFNPLPLGYSCI